MLEIGGNRAIDLVVAKESSGGFRRGAADPGRTLGEDAAGGKTIVVKAGRYGPYVTDGTTNATLPRNLSQETVSLDQAISLLASRREAGGSKKAWGRKSSAKKPLETKSSKKAPSRKPAAKKPGVQKAGKNSAGKNSAAKKSATKKSAAKEPPATAAKERAMGKAAGSKVG